MGAITATWTENQTNRSSATLAAAGTDTNDIDLDASGYDMVAIQFNITIGSSSGVTVEIFSSPDSGTTEDDDPIAEFTTSGTLIKTLVISGVPYVAVKLTNDDGSNATGNIAVLFAGRTWNAA